VNRASCAVSGGLGPSRGREAPCAPQRQYGGMGFGCKGAEPKGVPAGGVTVGGARVGTARRENGGRAMGRAGRRPEAPRASSRSATRVLPITAAQLSGVAPHDEVASTSAPASRNARATSRWLASAAQCRGVLSCSPRVIACVGSEATSEATVAASPRRTRSWNRKWPVTSRTPARDRPGRARHGPPVRAVSWMITTGIRRTTSQKRSARSSGTPPNGDGGRGSNR
jgi:hypothetical protein